MPAPAEIVIGFTGAGLVFQIPNVSNLLGRKHIIALALLLLLYLGFAFFYMVTIYLSIPVSYEPELSWDVIWLDYPLKALFTLPLWWLVFRHLKGEWSRPARMGLLIGLMPIWVKGWQQTYYWIIEQIPDERHLSGSAEWWDIYTPGLFYFIQFGIFFAWEYHTELRASERRRAASQRFALQSELSALKAQLNPHFLYNAFNTISASVPAGQESTRELIAKLSDMFRFQLNASREETLPLRQEVGFIEDYLNLEKARFGDRLLVEIAIDDEVADCLIPPMLLQPMVENAILHGISPKLEGGLVRISAERRGNQLHMEVYDSGIGIDPEQLKDSKGFGLENTRRRLHLLYGHDLIIQQPDVGGTLIIIEIPIQHAAKSTADRRRGARPQTPERVPESLS